MPSSAELRSVDLASGKTDSVLSGVSVTDYDMSRDETEVAFTTTDSGGASQIWLAPLDRRTPPRRIADGDQVSFGAEGDLVFRSLEGTTNFPVRIKKDGSGRELLTSAPILEKFGVSPDGEWVTALTAPGVNELSAPQRRRTEENLCPTLRGRVVFRREIPLRGDRPGLFRSLSGKDPRDSCAGRQITARLARDWNRFGDGRGRTTRHPSDRAWFSVTRARPFDIRVHQDRPAAQSVSDTSALTASQGCPDEAGSLAENRAPQRRGRACRRR